MEMFAIFFVLDTVLSRRVIFDKLSKGENTAVIESSFKSTLRFFAFHVIT